MIAPRGHRIRRSPRESVIHHDGEDGGEDRQADPVSDLGDKEGRSFFASNPIILDTIKFAVIDGSGEQRVDEGQSAGRAVNNQQGRLKE